MDIHPKKGYWIFMIIGGLFSFGVITIVLWFGSRKWPKRIDTQGITLRNGKTYLWSQLSSVHPVTVVNSRGNRVTGRLDLAFGKDRVSIVPQSIQEGYRAITYIGEVTGIDVASG